MSLKRFVPFALLLLVLNALISFLMLQYLQPKAEDKIWVVELSAPQADSSAYYKTLLKANLAVFDEGPSAALKILEQVERDGDAIWSTRLRKQIQVLKQKGDSTQRWRLVENTLSGYVGQLRDSLGQSSERLRYSLTFIDSLQVRLEEQRRQNQRYQSALQSWQMRLDSLKETAGELHFQNEDGAKVDYYGELEGKQAEGHGIAIFNDRGLYEGEWKDNQRHGKGKYIWHNGDRYEGEFVKGKRSGQGTYYFASGERYEGAWENDYRHGEGKFYNKKGKLLLQGHWENDVFQKEEDWVTCAKAELGSIPFLSNYSANILADSY